MQGLGQQWAWACWMLAACLPWVSLANTTNTTPYAESFETYTNGCSLLNTNGWSGSAGRPAISSMVG